MAINYYPDCHKSFINLSDLTQLWFKKRIKLKEKDLKKLFDLFLEINSKLEEIKDTLTKE